MVMVLLFLGVVFLLVGFQAMGSGDDERRAVADRDDHHDHHQRESVGVTRNRPRPRCGCSTSRRCEGAAEGTANRLREGGWNVAETGNLELPNVTANTVYFSDAPGEREAADEVGRLLEAPVEPRLPELAEQPPGVVVVVTG